MPSPPPTPPDATRARYETLLEVAESIAAHRQLSTLFADLSRCLKRLVSFDFISLTLLDAQARRGSACTFSQTDHAGGGADPRSPPVRAKPPPAWRSRPANRITSPISPQTAVPVPPGDLFLRQRRPVLLHSSAVHRAARPGRPPVSARSGRTPIRRKTSNSCNRWRARWPWPWITR